MIMELYKYWMLVPTCIPKDKLIKITPMKHLSYFILSFMLLISGGCSNSGNPVTADPPSVDDCGVTNCDNSSCVNYSTEIQPILDSKFSRQNFIKIEFSQNFLKIFL